MTPYLKRMIREQTAAIEDIKTVIQKKGIQNCFSDQERARFFNGKHFSRIAARYLAKQLILEELPHLQDIRKIEILNDPYGKPVVTFMGRPLEKVLVSLSHSRKFARALVIFNNFEE